jgi:hypothetical protein
MMVFEKGGRFASGDRIKHPNRELSIESSFNYLIITLQITWTSFRKHVKWKAQTAIRAMQDTKKHGITSPGYSYETLRSKNTTDYNLRIGANMGIF